MKSICKTFLGTSVIFRDESNDSSFTMFGYSNATVNTLNYSLIVWSKGLIS